MTSFTFCIHLHSSYFCFLLLALLNDFSAGTPLKNWVISDGSNLFSILAEKVRNLIEKDHLCDCSPEKDCCLRLMFRQPVRKLSSDSSDTFSQLKIQ